ncbi:MAG TPA: tetratricopeptide repeat protein, partial [Polyangiaceae bacterium]|nr:tetratricopeptide repeat protein [Polyangiaceae bacterium]
MIDPPRPERPLLGAWSALGLMAAAGVAFAALFPLSRDREARALSGAPDMLALVYLDLALARSPHDASLRLRVAERRLAAGQFERAREALAPLAGVGSPELWLLRLEIEQRAWAAVAGTARAPAALARLVQALEQTPHEQLPPSAAERVAELSAQAGQHATRAAILARLARADLGDDQRLRAADAAWLEAGQPLAAAQLRAERALAWPERDGAVQAALALRRALAAGQPAPTLALFHELSAVFGDDPSVLVLGLAALAGVDDREALGVAERLLAMQPDDAALQQRVAELRAWTAAAVVAPTAPAVAPSPPEPLRWDSAEALQVDVRAAENGERVIETATRLERMGAPERALQLLDGALARSLVDERALWELKADVQVRSSETRAALATLARADDRFGATRASLRRRAELLLSLGEPARALELLASAPGARELADERLIGALGWELGDVERVRAAYRVIARSPEASPDDVRRLWLLEREGGDPSAAARVALAGFERLGTPELLKLALHTALEANDDELVARALDAADRAGERLLDDPEGVRLRISARQGRAHRALQSAEPDLARAE